MSHPLGEPAASIERLDASSMNHLYRTLPAAVALACSSVTASAETITVCASGCDYTSINAAIAAANEGDVIQLAAETYSEGEQIDTLGKAITLRGVLDKTGEPASVLFGAGSHRVLICQSGETATTAFERLVIQSGRGENEDLFGTPRRIGGGLYNDFSSPTLTDCAFKGNSALYRGGAIYNRSSSPTVTDCTFTDNYASNSGGGMLNSPASNPILADCVFTGNSTGFNGGGIRNDNSIPTLVNCTFTGNSARDGGGIYNLGSSPALFDCTFTENSAGLRGGGMYNGGSYATLTDCTLVGNSSLYDGGGNNGGGMYNDSGFTTLVDCDICGNSPTQINSSFNDGGGNCVARSCDDCFPSCDSFPTDLDLNGITDGGDLGVFFVYWGDCQVEDCPADFNDDEVVDGIDLGILFSAWGPCT